MRTKELALDLNGGAQKTIVAGKAARGRFMSSPDSEERGDAHAVKIAADAVE